MSNINRTKPQNRGKSTEINRKHHRDVITDTTGTTQKSDHVWKLFRFTVTIALLEEQRLERKVNDLPTLLRDQYFRTRLCLKVQNKYQTF